MSGFPILDLVIGLIFVYFLLSIITSSAVELWFAWQNTRSKLMGQWLRRIFDMQALDSTGIPKIEDGKPVSVGQEIMNHCMVTALSKTNSATSYIDAGNFVAALLDKITLEPAAKANAPVQFPPSDLAGYIRQIEKSTVISGELKRTILSFAHQSAAAAKAAIPDFEKVSATLTTPLKSELDEFYDRLKNWYDTNAERLTGTLKRKKALPATFLLGAIITISLNADTVEISKYLYTNKEAAKQLADKAEYTYKNYEGRLKTLDTARRNDTTGNALKESTRQLQQDIDSLQSLGLPLGWSKIKFTNASGFKEYFFQWVHIGGWLATILAICMGAPFWFDLLNKISNVRGAGPKPVVSDDGGNKK